MKDCWLNLQISVDAPVPTVQWRVLCMMMTSLCRHWHQLDTTIGQASHELPKNDRQPAATIIESRWLSVRDSSLLALRQEYEISKHVSGKIDHLRVSRRTNVRLLTVLEFYGTAPSPIRVQIHLISRQLCGCSRHHSFTR